MEILCFAVGLLLGIILGNWDKRYTDKKLTEKAEKNEAVILGNEVYRFEKIKYKK